MKSLVFVEHNKRSLVSESFELRRIRTYTLWNLNHSYVKIVAVSFETRNVTRQGDMPDRQ